MRTETLLARTCSFLAPLTRARLVTLWVSIQDAPHLPEQAIINMLFGHSYETKPGPQACRRGARQHCVPWPKIQSFVPTLPRLQTAWKKPWSSVVRDVLHLSIERTFFDKMPCAFHVKGHCALSPVPGRCFILCCCEAIPQTLASRSPPHVPSLPGDRGGAALGSQQHDSLPLYVSGSVQQPKCAPHC